MSTDQMFDRLNGHDVLGARVNQGHREVLVTKPSHFRGLGWLRASRERQARDRSATWLRNAMIALGVLAVAAAVVSYAAQFVFVYAARHITAIAALEAGIPDTAALIFACLGIALALQGRRAVRARILNVGAVATSIFMNFAAAGGTGWRDVAIWIMPPVAYALASDTAIGVVRAWAIARQKALDEALDDDEGGPLAILAGVLLWMLRLALAPPSTVRGFRAWVLDECPVAPGRTAVAEITAETGPAIGPAPELPAIEPVRMAECPACHRQVPVLVGQLALHDCCTSGPEPEPQDLGDIPDLDDEDDERRRQRAPREGTKAARFLELVTKQHGDLAAIPLADTSAIATALAPEAELHPATARRELRKAALAAQAGDAR